jgi:molybdate transport system substrate-binding protein
MEKLLKMKYVSILTLFLVSLILVASLTGCSGQPVSSTPASTANPTSSVSLFNKEINVFAGSASKPPLDEAAKLFEKQTGAKVYLTYGGSGTVLSQMVLSKSGDVYIPGSPDYLLKSERDKVTDPNTSQIIAYLLPAIDVQKGNPMNIRSISDLAKPGIKVGIGNPNTVCVGLYAIEILDKNQLLTDVYKNIVTQASSCDNTATLISLKSVDAVMGWDVFQDWDPNNIERVYLKPNQIPRIAYIPAAISNYSQDKASAGAFIDFLVSKTGQDIFKKWGYMATETEARKYAPEAKIGGEYQLPDSYKALVK